jgi:molecular chaperone DnaK
VRELGERVPAADRERIEQQISELRTAMQDDDIGRIKQGSEALQQMAYALGQQAYAEREVGGEQTNENGSQGETVEGEFHEV